jgi:hypothetical protein
MFRPQNYSRAEEIIQLSFTGLVVLACVRACNGVEPLRRDGYGPLVVRPRGDAIYAEALVVSQ